MPNIFWDIVIGQVSHQTAHLHILNIITFCPQNNFGRKILSFLFYKLGNPVKVLNPLSHKTGIQSQATVLYFSFTFFEIEYKNKDNI